MSAGGPGADGDARPVRVLIVDDDPLVRAGLTMLLDGAGRVQVVAEAADGADVAAAVDAHRPDVVLMDLRMPRVDGVTATRRLRARPNPPQVVVLTTFDADAGVLAAVRAGASGFLLKDTPPAQIVDAVHRVAAGDPVLSGRVLRRLLDSTVAATGERQRALAALDRLSPRERDVTLAVARGASNAEIATELAMSLATVKAHVSRILSKLRLENRTQLALLAHDAGLV